MVASSPDTTENRNVPLFELALFLNSETTANFPVVLKVWATPTAEELTSQVQLLIGTDTVLLSIGVELLTDAIYQHTEMGNLWEIQWN